MFSLPRPSIGGVVLLPLTGLDEMAFRGSGGWIGFAVAAFMDKIK